MIGVRMAFIGFSGRVPVRSTEISHGFLFPNPHLRTALYLLTKCACHYFAAEETFKTS
jgi:hypothetical protein